MMIDWYTKNKSAAAFEISTAEELAGFAKLANSGTSFEGKTINLTSDIDLCGSDSKQWTAINGFSGTFDGHGHIVSGVYIDKPRKDFQGFFGNVSCCSIKNLGIFSLHVRGKNITGGFAGSVSSGTISNCYAVGMVLGRQEVGILAGSIYRSKITNCYSLGAASGKSEAGGLIGGSSYGCEIANCYFMGCPKALIGKFEKRKSKIISSYYNEEAKAALLGNSSGWDFKKIWAIDYSNETPYLQAFGPVRNVQVEPIAVQEYTGRQIKPCPKVTLNGKKLKPGTDFIYEYGENISPMHGGTVEIAGKADGLFGRKTVSFGIAEWDFNLTHFKRRR